MGRPIVKLENIKNTAMRLFALKGIEGVTIKDIAEHAECSEGALYRHYKSKDEMAWLLYKQEVEDFGSKIKQIYDSEEEYGKRLYSAIDLFYTFYDKEPIRFGFILLSQHNFPRELTINSDFNPYNIIYGFLKDGVKAKLFKIKDIKLSVALIFGLILQPPIMKATNRLDGTMKSKTKDVFESCISVLKTMS